MRFKADLAALVPLTVHLGPDPCVHVGGGALHSALGLSSVVCGGGEGGSSGSLDYEGREESQLIISWLLLQFHSLCCGSLIVGIRHVFAQIIYLIIY